MHVYLILFKNLYEFYQFFLSDFLGQNACYPQFVYYFELMLLIRPAGNSLQKYRKKQQQSNSSATLCIKNN